MDIDLLSKMVRETILEHDAVTLPGIGSFMAEVVPSTFSDKGYTIHPPYRRLYFSRREEGDTLLVDLYAASNGVPAASAERILTEFLAELKEVLKEKKTVVFPGLGRLRATRENNFFFVADEDLDIYPAGFGLKPISLKTHQETEEEVAEVVAGLASILLEPEPAAEEPAEASAAPVEARAEQSAAAPASTVVQPAEQPAEASASTAETPAEQQAEQPEAPVATPVETPAETPAATSAATPVETPAETPAAAPAAAAEAGEVPARPEPVDPWVGMRNVEQKHGRHGQRRRRWRRLLKGLGIALAVALGLLILYAVIARVAPEWVDRFLYTAEDLELVRSAF